MTIHLMSSRTPVLQLHRRPGLARTWVIRRLSDGAWWSVLLEQWVPDRELATAFQFYTVAALLGARDIDSSVTQWEIVRL